MNIEETKKAITVMQAYVDGAKIIHRPQGLASEWKEACPQLGPGWSWGGTEYRVSPKPTIRPFTPVEAAAHLGRRIDIRGDTWHLTGVHPGAVEVRKSPGSAAYTEPYDRLASLYKFENGEPCGVLIPQP